MDFCHTAPASLLERYLQEKNKTKSGKCYHVLPPLARLVLKSLTWGGAGGQISGAEGPLVGGEGEKEATQ